MSGRFYGFDKLIMDARSETEALLRSQECASLEFLGITSPIEHLFHCAFFYRLTGGSRNIDIEFAAFPKKPWATPDREHVLSYFTQCVVFDVWPIDFVLAYRVGEQTMRFAIECDGHDFHERTKEQAARDRSRDRELQNRHFRIFRFTGSEIYRNPLKCVDEVYGALCLAISEFEIDSAMRVAD